MNILKNFLVVAVVVLATVSCKNETKPEVKTIEVASEASKTLDPNATYAKAEFTIDGMTCEIGCAKTIEKKIAKMEGVKSAKVDFENKLAMVEYNDAKVTPTSLENTVTNVADIYKVSNMKTVEAFSSEKKCASDCEKNCANKTDAEKKACAEKCKKECSMKKA
ncbi:heavy-metal-associated domain-containing protein [Seonamhaeicola marinus]|uniref:Heavy-metal-associated domain-containing protein n=1 Tax=Seonamhaeicola marinus TaxID=1912246 RepID=A0A5D0HLD1_9FLAO|nr:heavy metal-associated domain-containing protein [Seonamhaeicola marinus]TYA70112.1 heavy-metal-associated domain-containing protein [Seonamhaeicola marinus]